MKLSDIAVKITKKKEIKETGFIIYKGLSPIDNNPIVAIATIKSNNVKTGNMVQVWILKTDIAPHKAIITGEDISICGSCKFKSGGGCYVRTEQAPRAIFNAYHKGNYKKVNNKILPLLGAGRQIRLGAYGDPSLIPFNIIESLLKNADGCTGYTHLYNESFFDVRLLKYLMVSTDSQKEAALLNDLNIRTFTPIAENEELKPFQIVCPNFTHQVKCKDCLLCDGGKNGKSIVAPIHGLKFKIDQFKKNRG